MSTRKVNGASEERFGSPGHRKPRPQKACEMEVIVRQRTDMEHLTVKSSVTRQNEEFRLSLFWGWRWGGAHWREGDLRARQAQEGVRGVLGSGSDPIFAHSACDPGSLPIEIF